VPSGPDDIIIRLRINDRALNFDTPVMLRPGGAPMSRHFR
jgi:hypothetical protein